ncbi:MULTISPECIES: hypothetical protein [unclassified Microcoleus]|uniref:hypothetical protein n=1 Tax=unclassified Microcoleus TaxID=2642155 RepID=UPI002FD36287
MSAGFEVEMVLVGQVLLRVRNWSLATEFLTTATAILARSSALRTGAIEMNAYQSWTHSTRSYYYRFEIPELKNSERLVL